MKLIEHFTNELEKYCADNGYDYHKALKLPRCGNGSILFIQHVDFNNAPHFIDDSEPAEIVLEMMRLENGEVVFKKGKNADKWLM